jgi:hypothetical protein
MDAEQVAGHAFSRRSALKRTAGVGLLLSQAAVFEQLAFRPTRARAAVLASSSSSSTSFSDIQFDLGAFFPAAQTLNDGGGAVQVGLPPVFALIQPLTLNRTPSTADQTTFANALNTIEANFDASPEGLLIQSVAYGIPYFNLLKQSVVKASIPTTLANGQPALIEAVPFDSDVVGGLVGGSKSVNPGVTKARFNVNVKIEANHVLLQTRSDNLANLTSANLWLQGSNSLNGSSVPSPKFNGLFSFQTPRVQFVQQGLPKSIAQQNGFEFADRMNSFSTMAMGFIDQQTNSAGPPAIVTFAGNSSAVLTSAKAGDYFDNGSIQHLAHDIEDLYQFFATASQEPNKTPAGEPFTERVQYMFRSNQTGTTNGLPDSNAGNSDQFTNGGGPALLANLFQGTGAALAAAQDSAGTFSSTNGTRRPSSSSPGPRTAPRCTSGRTALASTAWTCRPTTPAARATRLACSSPRAPTSRPGPTCSSWNSPSSSRPPSSSPRCATPRPRPSSRRSSWAARAATTAWRGTSPRHGGRTSWCRPGGTGPSR